MWMNLETTKVGQQKYTENVLNKKLCDWMNEGIKRFNKLLEEVRNNQNKHQYSNAVEDAIFKTLAERDKALLGPGTRIVAISIVIK
jgi:uracil DNA glycosylase